MLAIATSATHHRCWTRSLILAMLATSCTCTFVADREMFGASLGLHPRNMLLSEGLLSRATVGARAQVRSTVEVWRDTLAQEFHLGRMVGLDRAVAKAVQQCAAFGISSFSASVINNLQQLPLARQSSAPAIARQSAEELTELNQKLEARLGIVMEPKGWETVLRKNGVEVSRKRITGLYEGGELFFCVRAVSVLDAEPKVVFEILRDSRRVDEYNKECAATRDLARLSEDTKLMWASSKTYFPFKPRDFVTRVHSKQLDDGSYVIMSESPEEHVPSPERGNFVRTKVLISGSVMRPLEGDPSRTEFTTIGHLNPGGAADTPLGAQLANKICIHGPVSFIRKLEKAAQNTPRESVAS